MKCRKLISKAMALILAACLLVPQPVSALTTAEEDYQEPEVYDGYADGEYGDEYEDPETAARRELEEQHSYREKDKITYIAPLDDSLYMLWATAGDSLSILGLPDALTVRVQAPEGEAAETDVAVTWRCPSGYDASPGNYNLIPDFGQDYEVTGEARVPVVMLTVTPRMMVFGMIEGIGTEENPLLIDSHEVLRDFALRYNSGELRKQLGLSEEEKIYVKLTADIDLGVYNNWDGWTPIGTDDTPFTGEFDGNGHIISNIKFLAATVSRGMFGYVAADSVIESFGLENVYMNAAKGSGAIAGTLSGTIRNCYVTGFINAMDGHPAHGGGERFDVSGIAGTVNTGGEITGCYVTASIFSDAERGVSGSATGLAHKNYGDINNCVVLSGIITGGNGYKDNTNIFYGNDQEIPDEELTAKNLYCIGNINGDISKRHPGAELKDVLDYSAWPEVFTKAPWSIDNVEEGGRVVSLPYLSSEKKSPLPAHINGLKGAGTSQEPYEVTSVEDLQYMSQTMESRRSNFKNIYFKLTQDIDFKQAEFLPIGNERFSFEGKFDGNGHAIKNMKISIIDRFYVGLFGKIVNGEVKNLGLENCDVEGFFQVGAIAGMLENSTVSGCYVTGKVSSRGTETGGITGFMKKSTVERSWTNLDFKSDGKGGGIAGVLLDNSHITDCYTLGEIFGTSGMPMGCIAGWILRGENNSITRCYSTCKITMEVSGANRTVLPPGYGGILGSAYSGTVANCIAINEEIIGMSVHRIVGGKNYSNVTLKNNGAWLYTNMGLHGTGSPDTAEGKGYTLDEMKKKYVWDGLLSSGAWEYADGELPRLHDVGGQTSRPIPDYEVSDMAKEFEWKEPGKDGSYYKVTTVGELRWIRDKVNQNKGKPIYVKLGNDIDMGFYTAFEPWESIGTLRNQFTGIFDGDNHEITGLRSTNGGLFGNVCYTGCYVNGSEPSYGGGSYAGYSNVNPNYEKSGVIKNLGLVDCDINATNDCGGIAKSINGGAITNCYVTGTIKSVTQAGGIVCNSDFSIIQGCMFSGSITGKMAVGGIAGVVYNCEYKVGEGGRTLKSYISDCYSTGSISLMSTTIENGAGGIVGTVIPADIVNANFVRLIPEVDNCYTTMQLMAQNDGNMNMLGGIVGYTFSISRSKYDSPADIFIRGCFSLAKIPEIDSDTKLNHMLAWRRSDNSTDDDTRINYKIGLCAGWKEGFDQTKLSFLSQGDTTVFTSEGWLDSKGVKFLKDNYSNSWWIAVTNPGQLPILKNIPLKYQTRAMPYDITGDQPLGTPLKISNVDDLKQFRKIVNGSQEGRYQQAVLAADIDLKGENWVPIGNSETQAYRGTFNGNGHTISGLKVDTKNSAGLFGYLDHGAEISNLHVEAISIKSRAGDAGGIAGTMLSNAKNIYCCAVTGPVLDGDITNAEIISEEKSAGGIVGSVETDNKDKGLMSLTARADVTALVAAGGIVGSVGKTGEKGAELDLCISMGNVYSDGMAGGIVGEFKYDDVSSMRIKKSIALNESVKSDTGNADPLLNLAGGKNEDKKRIVDFSYYFADMALSQPIKGDYAESVKPVAIDDIANSKWDMYKNYYDDTHWNKVNGMLPVQKIKFSSQATSEITEDEKGQFSEMLGIIPKYIQPLNLDGDVLMLKSEADIIAMKNGIESGAERYVTGSYRLVNDITMTEPMEPIERFNGQLDGGHGNENYTIYDLNIAGKSNSGLFSVLGEKAVVSNVNFEDATVVGKGTNTGILAGQVEEGAIISNVKLSGTVTGACDAGGLAGNLCGDAEKVTSSAKVTGTTGSVGAIAGTLSGSLSDCTVTSEASAEGTSAGGAVGEVTGGNISRINVKGSVTGNEQAGGIAGRLKGGANVAESCFSGLVECYGEAGGIAGSVENSKISDSYSAGKINLQRGICGGIAGAVSSSTVQNTYCIGSFETYGNAGGIAGSVQNATISNNAALSQSLTGMSGTETTNRIVAHGETKGENIAYSGMKIDNEKPDGKAVTKAELWEEPTWTGLSFDVSEAGPWVFDGKAPFPILRDMQGQDMSAPSYLTGFAVGKELGLKLSWTNETDKALNDETLSEIGNKLQFKAELLNADNVTGAQREIAWEVSGKEGVTLGQTTGNTNTVKIQENYEGTFTVKAKMKSNSKIFDEMEFVVYGNKAAPPVIIEQPVGGIYETNQTVEISVTAQAADDGELSYQWYKEGAGAISGATGPEYVISKATSGTAIYYAEVTNTRNSYTCTVKTDEAEVIVQDYLPAKPEITGYEVKNTLPDRNGHVYQGDKNVTITVKATVTSGGALSFRWYKDGQEVSGETKDTLLVDTSVVKKISYQAIAINTETTATGNTYFNQTVGDIFPVEVEEKPAPTIDSQPASISVKVGDKISLNIVATGDDLTYQWFELIDGAGEEISEEKKPTYYPDTSKVGGRSYYVEVTNKYGVTVKSDTVKVTVAEYEAPIPRITYQTGSQSVLPWQGAKLSVTVFVREGELTYQWYEAKSGSTTTGTAIEKATGSSYEPDTSSEGEKTYFVIVTNTHKGKSAQAVSSAMTVTVQSYLPEQPVIAVQPQKTIKLTVGDQPAKISVKAESQDGGQITYEWYVNDGSGDKYLSSGETISIQADKAGTFTYYAKVINTVVHGREYTNTLNSDACTVTIAEKIPTVVINFTLQPDKEKTVKAGNPVTLTAGAETNIGQISYQWYRNTSDSTERGTKIDNATRSSIEIVENTPGTYYYYVGVSAIMTGEMSAEKYSDICKVTVTEPDAPPQPSTGGGGGGSYKPSGSFLTIAGVDIPYVIENGILILMPEKSQIDEILKNAGGLITVDAAKISGIKGIEIQLKPSWLSGKGAGMMLAFRQHMSVELEAKLWQMLQEVSGDRLLSLRIVEGSLEFSIMSEGKELPFSAWEYPVKVIMPWNEDTGGVMVNAKNDSIIPFSMKRDGYVVARVYEAGTFDAKAVADVKFSDTAGLWMEEAVRAMAGRGVVKGKAEGVFDATGKVTRAQFVTMLMRMIGRDAYIAGESYADQSIIPEWALTEALTAKALGIAKGDAAGNFNPDDEVTRQDMFVMVYRVLKAMHMTGEETAETNFRDWNEVSDYAREATGMLAALGLVSGSDGGINPQGTATRAEAAQLLYNVVDYVSK